MNDQEIKKLQNQIEYYFSNKNLENDEFFYNLLKNSDDRQINLEVIHQCNNIKKLNPTDEDIKSALINSSIVEVNDKAVYRKDKSLPLFLGKKKKLNNENDKEKENDKDKDKEYNIRLHDKDPIILYMTNNKDVPIRRFELEQKIKEIYPEYKVIYTRFGYQKGHIAIIKNEDEGKEGKEENDNNDDIDIYEKSFMMNNDILFTIRKANSAEIEDFWKNHGSHYEYCLGMKAKTKKSSTNMYNNLKHPLTIGGVTYNDIGMIRSRARNIFYKNFNLDSCIVDDENDKSFLIDLFKYVQPDVSVEDTIKIEKQCSYRHGKSFYIYKNENKKEIVSYLNACQKILIQNKRNK